MFKLRSRSYVRVGERADELRFDRAGRLRSEMPAEHSAGVLLYRRRRGVVEVLLGHMGGPFWARRHAGAWTIPKGGCEPGEEPLAAAQREFREEFGIDVPSSHFVELGTFEQSRRKLVSVWAAEGDLDAAAIVSTTFELEWPPKSGRVQQFPEIDRAAWFSLDDARTIVVTGQIAALNRLAEMLAGTTSEADTAW
jgi:predicted NUDIX family NTP pyrophosphohydrolase